MSSIGPPIRKRLFAHRGSSLLAPENTQCAFDFAVRCGCHVLETDVRLSRDNEVIVIHDDTVDRTTNGSGLVCEKSLSELTSLNAGSQFIHSNDLGTSSTQFARKPQSLMTLQQLIRQYPHQGINIDIKDNDIAAADAVANVLGRLSPTQWVNVGSFHAKVIKHFRKLMPNTSTAATREEVGKLFFGLERRRTLPYQVLQIPTAYWGLSLCTPRFIKRCHSRNLEVLYWTINNVSEMTKLLERGANGIVTDRPDLAAPLFNHPGSSSR